MNPFIARLKFAWSAHCPLAADGKGRRLDPPSCNGPTTVIVKGVGGGISLQGIIHLAGVAPGESLWSKIRDDTLDGP